MYSTLMVHLELGRDNAALLGITGDLAERFDTDVIGIVAGQLISIAAGDDCVSPAVIEQDRNEVAAQIKAAEDEFRTALQYRSRQIEWRSIPSCVKLTEYIATQMRSADLLITGVNSRGSWLDPARRVDTADLIMQVGRPVLVAPAQVQKLWAKGILVGWKDTRETRRAVAGALPFLIAAKRVVVVECVANAIEIAEGRKNAQDVCDWLGRHDVSAESLALVADDDCTAPLEAIAQNEGADLVVAGAYGHTRLHEWVLGGVTRDLLLQAQQCSLLSH